MKMLYKGEKPEEKIRRQWLLEAIHCFLIPEFEKIGFYSIPLAEIEKNSREIQAAFPFGRLRRERSSAFDQAEIQLEKYGGAAFRINLGIVPINGINHFTGNVCAEETWVHYLDSYGEMKSQIGWFQVRNWPWVNISEDSYIELVKWVSGLIPEVELFFASQYRSKHIFIRNGR